MTYFQSLIVNTLTFISLSVMFPNMIHVSSLFMAILASFILSVLNASVKPILHILSLPITLITFGLFSFVINGVMLIMVSTLVGTYYFSFSSFGAAFIVSIIMSIVNSIVINHKTKNKY